MSAAGQPLQLDDSRTVTAFFATVQRDGRWVVPDRLTVTVVGGQVILDLREAMLQGMHTVLHTSPWSGASCTWSCRSGSRSRLTNSRQPGRVRPDLATRQVPTPPGSPLIEVRSFTVAGRVHVHAPRRGGARWRDRFARRGPGPR